MQWIYILCYLFQINIIVKSSYNKLQIFRYHIFRLRCYGRYIWILSVVLHSSIVSITPGSVDKIQYTPRHGSKERAKTVAPKIMLLFSSNASIPSHFTFSSVVTKKKCSYVVFRHLIFWGISKSKITRFVYLPTIIQYTKLEPYISKEKYEYFGYAV